MIAGTRMFILAFISLALLSACGGGGGKKQPDTSDPPADTELTWDDDNWDERNWQ